MSHLIQKRHFTLAKPIFTKSRTHYGLGTRLTKLTPRGDNYYHLSSSGYSIVFVIYYNKHSAMLFRNLYGSSILSLLLYTLVLFCYAFLPQYLETLEYVTYMYQHVPTCTNMYHSILCDKPIDICYHK